MPIASIPAAIAAISAIVSAGGEAYKIGHGIHQNNLAKKLQASADANRPEYKQDPNVLYNQMLAKMMAGGGLPESTKTDYTNNINRTGASAINALEQTGQGGINSISGIYDQQANAFAKLLSMDAEQKLGNQQLLMGANKDVSEENKTAFDYNQNIPYQQIYQHIAQLTNAAPQNIYGGVTGLGNIGTALSANMGSGTGNKIADSNLTTNNSNNDAITNLTNFLKGYQGGLGNNNQGGFNTQNSAIPNDLNFSNFSANTFNPNFQVKPLNF